MEKNYFSKFNLLKLFFLMNLLKSNLFHDKTSSEVSHIILKASNFGYDLTNPYDEFFIDICIAFSDNKKDVTLDYRRKYFFFLNIVTQKIYLFIQEETIQNHVF